MYVQLIKKIYVSNLLHLRWATTRFNTSKTKRTFQIYKLEEQKLEIIRPGLKIYGKCFNKNTAQYLMYCDKAENAS